MVRTFLCHQESERSLSVSIGFPRNVVVINNQIKIPKVGLITAVITRPIEAIIKTVTISITPSGKYFAAIGLDLGDKEVKQSTDGVITGIDLGLKDYVTCHNGTDTYSVKHPKWIKQHERSLRRHLNIAISMIYLMLKWLLQK